MTEHEAKCRQLLQTLAKMTTEQLTEFLNHPEVRSTIGYEAIEAFEAMLDK